MKIYVGAVAAVLAIAAIGCGGGGDSAEAPLTKAQFIKRGDAICRAAQDRKRKAIQAWSQESGNKGKALADWSVQELGQIYVTLALPPIKEASDELASLTPPAGDAKATKIVASLGSAVEEIEKRPTKAIKGAPYMQADRLAQAYGFEVCGLF